VPTKKKKNQYSSYLFYLYRGVKRPAAGAGLGGVLSKIGKKQKMGTLVSGNIIA
jgi:hypothetical protein